MLRPDDLYEIVDESVTTGVGAPPRVLVHALDGFMDAGQAGRVTADHLLDVLDHRLLARFDVDLLHDYRARRPEVTFVEDRFVDYTPPALSLHLLTDDAGMEFLLLEGAEPDAHWERYADAVRQLVDRYHVTLTVGVHGIPMARSSHPPAGPDGARDPRGAGQPHQHLGGRDAAARQRLDHAAGPARRGRPGRDGFRRPRAALPGRQPVPRRRAGTGSRCLGGDRTAAAEQGAAGRGRRHRPDGRRAGRRRPTRPPPWSAHWRPSTTPRPDRSAAAACSPPSRCRPGEELSAQVEQFLAELDRRRRLTCGGLARGLRGCTACRSRWMTWSSCWTWSRSTTDLFRGPPARDVAAAGVRRPGARPGAGRGDPYGRPGPGGALAARRTSSAPGTPPCRSSTSPEPTRDGGSFSSRRVVASQHGKPIFYMSASFQRARTRARPRRPDARPAYRRRMRRRRWRRSWRPRPAASPTTGTPSGPRSTCALADPGRSPVLDPCRRDAARRPVRCTLRARLRERPDAARRQPAPARADHRRPADPDGVARPRDVVPPRLPRRRVDAVRPGVAVRVGCPRLHHRPAVHRRRPY